MTTFAPPNWGNAPPEMERLTVQLAQMLRQLLPVADGVGWQFTLFNFGAGQGGADGWCTYASTAQRGDVVRHLRELADKLEASGERPRGRRG